MLKRRTAHPAASMAVEIAKGIKPLAVVVLLSTTLPLVPNVHPDQRRDVEQSLTVSEFPLIRPACRGSYSSSGIGALVFGRRPDSGEPLELFEANRTTPGAGLQAAMETRLAQVAAAEAGWRRSEGAGGLGPRGWRWRSAASDAQRVSKRARAAASCAVSPSAAAMFAAVRASGATDSALARRMEERFWKSETPSGEA